MPYNPSARKRAFQQGHKMSKNRIAWARVAWGSVAMMFYPDAENLKVEMEEEGVQSEAATEIGPTIRLLINKNSSSRTTTIDLTMLTAEEIRCLRQLFNKALDEAEPICDLRDREAQRQHAQGDDSNSRIYRIVPQYVVRERPSSEHAQSVRDGHEDVPGGSRDGSASGEVRGQGDDVADTESRDDEPKDNGATPDLDTGVRSVGSDTDA